MQLQLRILSTRLYTNETCGQSKPRRYQIGQCETTTLAFDWWLHWEQLRLLARMLAGWWDPSAQCLHAGRIEQHGRWWALDIVYLSHQLEAIACLCTKMILVGIWVQGLSVWIWGFGIRSKRTEKVQINIGSNKPNKLSGLLTNDGDETWVVNGGGVIFALFTAKVIKVTNKF